MSVLSSSPTFMLNLKSRGLFSSQTAFQRPQLSSNIKKTQQTGFRPSISYSQENQITKASRSIQSIHSKEDPELVFCQPIKKVKFISNQTEAVNLLKTTKIHSELKSSKLTVEMVFDAPLKATKDQPNNFFEDDSHEDNSLSFISSCTSVDELEVIDEEEVTEVHKDQYNQLTMANEPHKSSSELIMEPLVVKDSFTNHMNYLNVSTYNNPNTINYPIMTSYNPYTNLNQLINYNSTFNGISNVNQFVQPNLNNYYPVQNIMNFPQIRAADFIQNPVLLEEAEISNHISQQLENIRAKANYGETDGYDSDSHATRSTGVGPTQEGGERSQKSLSPPYNATEEAQVEEKVQIISIEQIKKKKRGRKPKNAVQQEIDDVDGSMKVKKGRALNLDIDINPKHLKVERRLNKLQLLRYQQEAPEAEFKEYMKKITEVMPISRSNSLFNDTNDSQSTTTNEEKVMMMVEPKAPSYENTLATIPPFTLESSRRRLNSVTVWTPEDLNAEELDNYLQRLGEIVEFPITDQEKGLRLLKTFNMNIEATLEAVRNNKVEYSELLKMKVKRLRRY